MKTAIDKRVRGINKIKFHRKKLSTNAIYRRLKRLYRHLPSDTQKFIIDTFFKHLKGRPWGTKEYHQQRIKK